MLPDTIAAESSAEPTVAPIHLVEAIQHMQELLDSEALDPGTNLVTKKADCDWTEPLRDRNVRCGHRAVFQRATKHPCGECGKTEKSVETRYCFLHGINVFGRNLRPKMVQMDLTHPEDISELERQRRAEVDMEVEVDGQSATLRGVVSADESSDGDEHLDDDEIAAAERSVSTSGSRYADLSGSLDPRVIVPAYDDATVCWCGWSLVSKAAASLHERRHLKAVEAVDAGDYDQTDAFTAALAAHQEVETFSLIGAAPETPQDARNAVEPKDEPEGDVIEAPPPKKRAPRAVSGKKTTPVAKRKRAKRSGAGA